MTVAPTIRRLCLLPEARRALETRELAVILRCYRKPIGSSQWANSWDTTPPTFPRWSDGPTVGTLGSSPHIVKSSQVTALSVPWPLVVSVLRVVRAVLDDQYVLTSTYFAVRGIL